MTFHGLITKNGKSQTIPINNKTYEVILVAKTLRIEEVKKLFESAANLKHRVFLKTVYSAGLRTGEAVRLKPRHIESDPSRMMIKVEQGKGSKDRYTVLYMCKGWSNQRGPDNDLNCET